MSGASSSVLIVGGGIAGLSAAVRLAERGVKVTVLETRRKLGGRATSFKDVRSERVLDNCQHVVLGCCTNYLDFLSRLGAAEKIRWYDEQYWIEEGGRVSVIRPGPLPTPAHFGVSMLRSSLLTFGEANALGKCCAAILRTDRAKWDDRTFGVFLREHGQTERVINRFWAPVVVSACNMEVDAVSAASALHVFQEGFLANRHAARIGVPSVPLVELYERAEEVISGAGGRVLLGAGVEWIDAHAAVTTAGERHEADTVICAVPVERVNRIINAELHASDPRFAPLDRFTHNPILGVHLEFDRNVMGELPHCVLVERGTQWIFRKNDAGTYVHAVISAADAWVGLDEEEIARRVVEDMRVCEVSPAMRDARLVRARAVKEKLATFAPAPGLNSLRPSATGPSGVVLAGDYTGTGWPATMEGAARSGYAAAAAVLGRPREEVVVRSLKVAVLSRMMGLKG